MGSYGVYQSWQPVPPKSFFLFSLLSISKDPSFAFEVTAADATTKSPPNQKDDATFPMVEGTEIYNTYTIRKGISTRVDLENLYQGSLRGGSLYLFVWRVAGCAAVVL